MNLKYFYRLLLKPPHWFQICTPHCDCVFLTLTHISPVCLCFPFRCLNTKIVLLHNLMLQEVKAEEHLRAEVILWERISYSTHDVSASASLRTDDSRGLLKSTSLTTYFCFRNADCVGDAKRHCHNPSVLCQPMALWTQICFSWNRWLSLLSRLLHKEMRASWLTAPDFQGDIQCTWQHRGWRALTRLQNQASLNFSLGSVSFWPWEQGTSFDIYPFFCEKTGNYYLLYMR